METQIKLTEMSICEVTDIIFPDFETQVKTSWEDECKLVLDYCKKNNFYLYERSREEFSKSEGYDLALKGGFSGVVYSDLS